MLRVVLAPIYRLVFAVVLLGCLLSVAEVTLRLLSGPQSRQSAGPATSSRRYPPSVRTASGFTWEPAARWTTRSPLDRERVLVEINSLGLRGPEPELPKPGDRFRILWLGDETLTGCRIDESQLATTVLAQRLQERSRRPIEVLNGGLPGGCPLTEYLHWRNQWYGLQPDLIVVHFDLSDVDDDRNLRPLLELSRGQTPLSLRLSEAAPRRVPAWKEWVNELRLTQWAFNSAASHYRVTATNQVASRPLSDSQARPYDWLKGSAGMVLEQALSPLASLQQLAAESGIPVVVTSAPKPWQVSARASAKGRARINAGVPQDAYWPDREVWNSISEWTLEHQLPYCDASWRFPEGRESESLFFAAIAELSPAGQAAYGNAVADYLIDRQPGPWNSPYFQSSPPMTRNTSAAQSRPRFAAAGQSAETNSEPAFDPADAAPDDHQRGVRAVPAARTEPIGQEGRTQTSAHSRRIRQTAAQSVDQRQPRGRSATTDNSSPQRSR